MKVQKKKIDDLNMEITLNVEAADYAEIERKKLSACRARADFKGFRKGNVPMSLVSRVYGEQILAESVNEVLSEQLNKTIEESKLHILGEPLASEKQGEIEWKSGNDFKFIFDLGLSPEVKVDVVKEDVIAKYDISVAAKDKEEMITNLKKYYEGKKEEKSDEDIEKEVSERLAEDCRQEAEWRLTKDIRDFYVKKAGIALPEDFLKRWLLFANEGKVSKEDVEKEFPGFAEDFKWQLLRGSLMKSFGFEIKPEDLTQAAKSYVNYQYAMYGLGNVPEDVMSEAVSNIMHDQKQVDRLVEQVEDEKVLSKIKEIATIKPKKITSEKFRELK